MLGAECLEERALLEAPVTVDGGAVGSLGAGKRESVGRAGRGRRGEGLDVRLRLASGGSGSHGCVRDGGVREDAQTGRKATGATRLYLTVGAFKGEASYSYPRSVVCRVSPGYGMGEWQWLALPKFERERRKRKYRDRCGTKAAPRRF